MAHPGRIAFIDTMQFFPKAQTLVGQHLHKAIETPIIIYHAIADLPLPPFLGDLLLPLLDDHLPLGKIEVTQLLITLALLMEMTQAVSGVRSTISLRLHLDTCAYFPLYSHYNYSFIDVDLCHSLSS